MDALRTLILYLIGLVLIAVLALAPAVIVLFLAVQMLKAGFNSEDTPIAYAFVAPYVVTAALIWREKYENRFEIWANAFLASWALALLVGGVVYEATRGFTLVILTYLICYYIWEDTKD